MKLRHFLFLVGVGVSGLSCGLETVATLSPPPARYDDDTNVTESKISFQHDAVRYAGTDFLGYEVYYKIYPVSTSDTFARLLADQDTLAASPTVNRLTSTLGYSRMTVSQYSDTLLDQEYLLVKGLSGGELVSLDFTDFLAAGAGTLTQPVLKIGGVSPAKSKLFRNIVLGGTADQGFGALRSTTVRKTDMDSTWTTANGQAFEVNLFVVAYGFTATLDELRSKPVPWGVIRTIKP